MSQGTVRVGSIAIQEVWRQLGGRFASTKSFSASRKPIVVVSHSEPLLSGALSVNRRGTSQLTRSFPYVPSKLIGGRIILGDDSLFVCLWIVCLWMSTPDIEWRYSCAQRRRAESGVSLEGGTWRIAHTPP